MKKFLTIVLALLVAIPAAVYADGTLTMDYSLFETVLRTIDTAGDVSWLTTPAGSAELSYSSTGNRNVKSEVALSIVMPDISTADFGLPKDLSFALVSLDKAYVKARFPEFRLTAGKTRLSWGDGFVFNAGDILFDSLSTAVDLTSSEVRSDTDWLVSVNVPLGRFSFAEAVLLPPDDMDLGHLSAGGRLYTTIESLKLETGYMFTYDAAQTGYEHRLSLGLQGNLEADWYLSGAVSLPGPGYDTAGTLFEDSLDITAGLFYIHQIDSVRTLTLGLESLIQPYESWAESAGGKDYGIFLYPEIGFTPNDTVSLSLRSIYSPIDGSAQVTAGGSWNVFQGFSLLGYLIGQVGDDDDLFSWGNTDPGWTSLTCMVGVNYIY